MKHAITSVVIIIAISLFGCSESSKVNDIFSKAEQLMDVQPDSALLLLQGVNTDELSTKEGKARHALLLSQAYDKNYIDLTNDSLINIAVEYYNGKGNINATTCYRIITRRVYCIMAVHT